MKNQSWRRQARRYQWLKRCLIASLCYLLCSGLLFSLLGVFGPESIYAQEADGAQAPVRIEDANYLAQLEMLKAEIPMQYISPRPGAQLVSAGTTIVLRPGPAIAPHTVSAAQFSVVGSNSGLHQGTVHLATDGRTVLFAPTVAFAPEETVTVTLPVSLQTSSGQVIPAVTFSFTIAPERDERTDELPGATRTISQEHRTLPSDVYRKLPDLGVLSPMTTSEDAIAPTQVAPEIGSWPYYTLPADLPLITVTVATDDAADGYLFLSNFTLGGGGKSPYRMIVDNTGIPVYYQPGLSTDFKQQPNGWLTYYSSSDQAFHALDSSYQITRTWQAGNGYTIDFHEFLLLPNDHALFMIYDEQKVNMDDIVEGGIHAARVTGLVIQELDTEQNVVFEWRSWDHIPIIDTIVPITTTPIDYMHGNAIEVDYDGNLLISSRHLNEITKISRETGDVIWRLGGKQNQFTFIDDDQAPFALQHDIRRQPSGSITLFDNRNGPPSRGTEYWLDEINRTASLIWAYESAPNAHAFIVGNVQRLPNGNSLIGWGSTWPTVTEVNTDNEKVFEMTLEQPHMSYRVHRYPWHGWPTWPATLVITEGEHTQLHYSWNGATDVFYYQIYAGATSTQLEIVDLQLRTDFEEDLDITQLLDRYCYFQVRPMGKDGRVGVASNVVYAGQTCEQIYLPSIMYENASGN